MKRTPLRRTGKIGEANHLARLRIATIAEEKGLNYCELQLDNCTRTWPLAPAHRHKRAWYKGSIEKLAAFEQWVSACQNCHDFIETRPIFTEEMFTMLRGKE